MSQVPLQDLEIMTGEKLVKLDLVMIQVMTQNSRCAIIVIGVGMIQRFNTVN